MLTRALYNMRSQQPPPLGYQPVRAAGRESRAAWRSAGAWELPAESATPAPAPASLPLPASLGWCPAGIAPLCARLSPLLRRKGGLRIRTSLQELRAGRPAPRQRSLLRSSYLLGSRRAIFRACLNDPEYLQWAVGSQPKRLHPPDPGGWRGLTPWVPISLRGTTAPALLGALWGRSTIPSPHHKKPGQNAPWRPNPTIWGG